jgi:hypothetical protein
MKRPIKITNKPTNLKETLLRDVQPKKHTDRPKPLLIINVKGKVKDGPKQQAVKTLM